MTTPPYAIDVLISAKSIAARVEGLAREITAHFKDTDKLVVVGLLRGSFVFIADLVRELDLPLEVDFLDVSSYGNSTESSREVRILKDLRGEIEGRDVLVVEDIVDTGYTLSHVLDILNTRHPRRIEVCALLDKLSSCTRLSGCSPRKTRSRPVTVQNAGLSGGLSSEPPRPTHSPPALFRSTVFKALKPSSDRSDTNGVSHSSIETNPLPKINGLPLSAVRKRYMQKLCSLLAR